MQPSSQKPEVVYRRTPDPGSSTTERGRGYAPALAPLVIGFLLLLAVILVLGLKSAGKLYQFGIDSRRLNLEYTTRLNQLSDLRLALMSLESEARLRDLSASTRGLKPPFDVRIDKARDDARQALKNLGTAAVSPEERTRQSYEQLWIKLKTDAEAFITATENVRTYNQDGFNQFVRAQADLNKALAVAQEQYQNIDNEM